MAAGGSRRFGGCKLLAEFRGAPLLSYALNTAAAISRAQPESISSVNLVLGGYADEIRAAVEQRHFAVNIFQCPDWASGLGHSLAYGVAQLPVENAVLIMLGDQPLVDAADLDGLLNSSKEHPGKIICAEFSSTLGVPAFFPAYFKPRLLQIKGDRGAKSILMNEREYVIAVSMQGAGMDIDFPADLQNRLEK